MTKLRAPISIEDALTRIAGRLGYAPAAALIGKEERTLRAYADPDDLQRQIKLSDAIKLDCAYRADGGEDAPILDAYALQLDACVLTSNRRASELAERISRIAKEGGEGMAALIQATLAGANAGDRLHAQRETREWIDALRAVLPLLEEEARAAAPP